MFMVDEERRYQGGGPMHKIVPLVFDDGYSKHGSRSKHRSGNDIYQRSSIVPFIDPYASSLNINQIIGIEDAEVNVSDKLFPGHPLYCEGMSKPKCRGVIHLLYAIALVLGIIHLYSEANGNFYGQVSSVIFVSSNLYCVGISALYHLGQWSYQREVMIQRMDHSAIAIYATGVNFPCSFLLLPSHMGVSLLALSSVSCIWVCWHVMNNRPAVWRFFVVSAMIVLFFPILFYEMTTLEFSLAIMNGMVQGVGCFVFVNKIPDPWPDVFGYHEVFHLITVIGMTLTYTCNWSINRTACTPYARHVDIIDLIAQYYMLNNPPIHVS